MWNSLLRDGKRACWAVFAVALSVIIAGEGVAQQPRPSDEDVTKALHAAEELMAQGDYEAALQDMLWYWEASKTTRGQGGVRLSFALSTWEELGEKYPKAKSALLDVRDADEAAVAATGSTSDTFHEYASINETLDEQDRTYAIYKDLVAKHPRKAQEYFPIVKTLLVENREYALCSKYVTDAESDMNMFISERRMEARVADAPQVAGNKAFFLRQADRRFEEQTRELIVILIGGDRNEEAATVQQEAAAVLNTTPIRTALQDAKASVSAP